jgi:hypothetical protein
MKSLGPGATVFGNRITRGSTRGACTMAARESRPNASRPSSSTAKLRLLLKTRGKGCAGSSPIGVRSGIISRKKYSRIHTFCASFHSERRRKRMPSFASAGNISSFSSLYWRCTMSCAARATCLKTSAGGRPSGPAAGAPSLICSFTPESRISKNSSRFEETMQRKRSRSSSGTFRSSACASTRRLNASACSSRLRKWAGFSRDARAGCGGFVFLAMPRIS